MGCLKPFRHVEDCADFAMMVCLAIKMIFDKYHASAGFDQAPARLINTIPIDTP